MKKVDRHVVSAVFKSLLDRDADQAALDFYENFENSESIAFCIKNSVEYKAKSKQGPLWNYTAIFDPLHLVLSFENPDRKEVKGHIVNYIGVAVDVDKFFPNLGVAGAGVEGPPVPGNWHSDISEFAAVFRAITFSGPTFRMAELGCGWGCWMNISGMAARLRGKDIFLTGIEGDPGHITFAREALSTNGIPPSSYKLIHGIAAGSAGTALFPRQNVPGVTWGLEPVFGASDDEISKALEQGTHDSIPMISMAEMLADTPRLDLLHIDIQGGEVSLISSSIEVLNEKVAYIVVGTHSRSIDGKIIDILNDAGQWTLEIERPCIASLSEHGATTVIDGLQGWRNTRLIPQP